MVCTVFFAVYDDAESCEVYKMQSTVLNGVWLFCSHQVVLIIFYNISG